MLKGKTVLIGVCGGIAAYKVCEVVSSLRKLNADVHVMMTTNATNFVTPLTFETLSKNAVVVNTFARSSTFDVQHISLAKSADVLLIAPATANIVAKIANGIADDFVSTTALATKAPILLAPAMNTGMYTNQAFVDNLDRAKHLGARVIDADSGFLACGDIGKGRMAEPQQIVKSVVDVLMPQQDLVGKKVLITAGGTAEKIDAVRYITNMSSGKMGIALCNEFKSRGAAVTLIAGHISVEIPKCIDEVVNVSSTDEMYNEVISRVSGNDIIVKAAAPSDYKVVNYSDTKLKGQQLNLQLVKNVDIASQVGKIKGNRLLVVFSAETDNLLENAKSKLLSKNADICVANDVSVAGAGFNVDTNIVTILNKNGSVKSLPQMSKSQVAAKIVDEVVCILGDSQ